MPIPKPHMDREKCERWIDEVLVSTMLRNTHISARCIKYVYSFILTEYVPAIYKLASPYTPHLVLCLGIMMSNKSTGSHSAPRL